MRTVIIACDVLRDYFDNLPDDVSLILMPQGLHDVPTKMTPALQDVIDSIEEPSIVLLGYGLCGTGTARLKSGKHWLVLPRADDCISLLMGSYERYLEEFNEHPGTYYLSRGWIEVGSDPMAEHHKYVEKYGEETAEWLTQQKIHSYTRVALVTSSEADASQYTEYAKKVADFCNSSFEEIVGSNSLTKALLEKRNNLEGATPDFLVLPPGSEVCETQFWR